MRTRKWLAPARMTSLWRTSNGGFPRRIAAIGPAGIPIPAEAQTIELGGLDVWPGMVDAGSTLGLFEIGSLNEGPRDADALALPTRKLP